MATVRYFLRSSKTNSIIQISFSISKKVYPRVSTGLSINSKDWSKTTNLPKTNNAENKNIVTKLKSLSVFIETEYNNDYTKGVIFSNSWLKSKVDDFFERKDPETDDSIFLNYLKTYLKYREMDTHTKKATDKKIEDAGKKFEEFQQYKKKKYLIEEIDAKTMLEFKDWAMNKRDRRLAESTTQRLLKNIKTVLMDAYKNDKPVSRQIVKMSIPSAKSISVYLDFDELKQVKNMPIVGNENLKHARDWFIIGCYTGQRISDLMRMNKKMICTKTDIKGEEFKFIELTQEKTGSRVTIPLMDEVEEILNKYNGDFPPVFSSDKSSNDTLFNRYIKKVCKLAGINEIVKGLVFNEEENRNEIKDTEKYNLISSHTCRRSFATNFYGNPKLPTPIIMAITGHKTGKTFSDYIKKDPADYVISSASVFKELSKERKEKENQRNTI